MLISSVGAARRSDSLGGLSPAERAVFRILNEQRRGLSPELISSGSSDPAAMAAADRIEATHRAEQALAGLGREIDVIEHLAEWAIPPGFDDLPSVDWSQSGAPVDYRQSLACRLEFFPHEADRVRKCIGELRRLLGEGFEFPQVPAGNGFADWRRFPAAALAGDLKRLKADQQRSFGDPGPADRPGLAEIVERVELQAELERRHVELAERGPSSASDSAGAVLEAGDSARVVRPAAAKTSSAPRAISRRKEDAIKRAVSKTFKGCGLPADDLHKWGAWLRCSWWREQNGEPAWVWFAREVASNVDLQDWEPSIKATTRAVRRVAELQGKPFGR